MKKPVVIFIVGPTGSGKTQVGLNLSRYLPCEYISADSMQIYKGMDIVTDKLVVSLRRKYPYHLLDVVPPSKEYSVAAFCLAAARKVRESVKRKKVPVVVGGTGLYVRSLIHGIFEERSSAEIRSSLMHLAVEKGNSFLHQRLGQVDPQAAGRIHVHDTKRLIRALEVFEMTRRPISELQQKRQGLIVAYDVRIFGLERDRADLYARIDQRVDFMVHGGLLDEVRRLLRRCLGRTASQCIGVREIEGFLKGQYGLEEAVRLMKRNTRHFAKRQMTWFRREPGIEWIKVAADDDLAQIARMIAERASHGWRE
ncbi:tRNA (adenosine(37)-N6)-dimethylallyltransferase MiaA [Candidatus Velamenicoccus archaeovorus]|uniref:tRNA dimethylallyltransferase n=1 Tax=Velamenicoccus archaeovorus TaxID=1930593 RepID=A0A410P3H8_VELA1|nr:tRNA (adenosine(37)-N6)-dimethylallyltransferase MiaA [Candidatus Velamenicoccus archaeovorus]QAT16755.1 tRNA (adenosine(37)-N6)-dimethylallyltransferase MiaA [Candidatus Velamenicoccus archaeovorus]